MTVEQMIQFIQQQQQTNQQQQQTIQNLQLANQQFAWTNQLLFKALVAVYTNSFPQGLFNNTKSPKVEKNAQNK